MHVSADACIGQKKASDLPELALEIVSYPTWILGTEFGFPARDMHAELLSHRSSPTMEYLEGG